MQGTGNESFILCVALYLCFELLVLSAYFGCWVFKGRSITLRLCRAEYIGSSLILGLVGLSIMKIVTTEYYQSLGIFFFFFFNLKLRPRLRHRTKNFGEVKVQRKGMENWQMGKSVINQASCTDEWWYHCSQITLKSCSFQCYATWAPCINLWGASLLLNHTAHQLWITCKIYPLQTLIHMYRFGPMLLSLWNLMGSQHEVV